MWKYPVRLGAWNMTFPVGFATAFPFVCICLPISDWMRGPILTGSLSLRPSKLLGGRWMSIYCYFILFLNHSKRPLSTVLGGPLWDITWRTIQWWELYTKLEHQPFKHLPGPSVGFRILVSGARDCTCLDLHMINSGLISGTSGCQVLPRLIPEHIARSKP